MVAPKAGEQYMLDDPLTGAWTVYIIAVDFDGLVTAKAYNESNPDRFYQATYTPSEFAIAMHSWSLVEPTW